MAPMRRPSGNSPAGGRRDKRTAAVAAPHGIGSSVRCPVSLKRHFLEPKLGIWQYTRFPRAR